MRFLLLCEGDAETWDSWSGSSRSLVEHLRAGGHTVVCGDADLYGAPRLVTALRTFSSRRSRWWVRYHLGQEGFDARSKRAKSILDEHASDIDAIIQVGATFRIDPPRGVAHVLYCDSNYQFAQEGRESGFSDAVDLSPSESEAVISRETAVYRQADKVFTMSHRLRRSFIESFGLPEHRVETLHAGPNFPPGKFPPVPQRDADRDPVILFIGRQFLRKGGDLLVQAFDLVKEDVPDAQLLIIGPDELPEEVQPVPDGVESLGFIDKKTEEGKAALFDAYSRARVFCLPTRYEPFGVVFLEAMHYELPCVGPRAWAVPEIIEEDVTGLLVPPEDPVSLAEALTQLLLDPARSTEMGLAGKQRMHGAFTWGHVAASLARSVTALQP